MKAGINLHERQNYAIQLSYKPLLLLAVVAGVPVKDVQPCDPKVLLRGLRGRAHDDPVPDNLLRCISRAAIFDRSPNLFLGGLDVKLIVGPLLRSHVECG